MWGCDGATGEKRLIAFHAKKNKIERRKEKRTRIGSDVADLKE